METVESGAVNLQPGSQENGGDAPVDVEAMHVEVVGFDAEATPAAPVEATAEVTAIPAGPDVVDATAVVDASTPKVKKTRRREPGTSAPRWKAEEEEQLRALVGSLGEKAWPTIATELKTGRSAAGVEQHWQILMGKRKRQGSVTPPSGVEPRQRVAGPRWTEEEEEHLKALVASLGPRAWKTIADQLGTTRTASGIEQHYQIMMGNRKRNSSAKKEPAAMAVVQAEAEAVVAMPNMVEAQAQVVAVDAASMSQLVHAQAEPAVQVVAHAEPMTEAPTTVEAVPETPSVVVAAVPETAAAVPETA